MYKFLNKNSIEKNNFRNITDDDNEFLGLNSDPNKRENELEIR